MKRQTNLFGFLVARSTATKKWKCGTPYVDNVYSEERRNPNLHNTERRYMEFFDAVYRTVDCELFTKKEAMQMIQDHWNCFKHEQDYISQMVNNETGTVKLDIPKSGVFFFPGKN